MKILTESGWKEISEGGPRNYLKAPPEEHDPLKNRQNALEKRKRLHAKFIKRKWNKHDQRAALYDITKKYPLKEEGLNVKELSSPNVLIHSKTHADDHDTTFRKGRERPKLSVVKEDSDDDAQFALNAKIKQLQAWIASDNQRAPKSGEDFKAARQARANHEKQLKKYMKQLNGIQESKHEQVARIILENMMNK